MPAFVGYANLPNQVFRKAVKRGFQFTLMVVGKYKLCSRCRGGLGGLAGYWLLFTTLLSRFPPSSLVVHQARVDWGNPHCSIPFS